MIPHFSKKCKSFRALFAPREQKYGRKRRDIPLPIRGERKDLSPRLFPLLGLLPHHKFEDHAIMLSTKDFAMKNPFEWQLAENLVYCDYLEHLFLHILICEYPAEDHNKSESVGIGGVIKYQSEWCGFVGRGFAPAALLEGIIYEYAAYQLGVMPNCSGTESETLKDLLVAMLDYGTQAQIHFNYRTDRLANRHYLSFADVGRTPTEGIDYQLGIRSG